MGIFTVNIGAQSNQPPSSVGWFKKKIDFGTTYVFSLDDFTISTNPVYVDPEGDDVEGILITSIPDKGVLKIRNVTCAPGFEIPVQDIIDGELTYEAVTIAQDSYEDSSFEFKIRDVGSMSYSSQVGYAFFIVTLVSNQPPGSIGSGGQTILLGASYTFSDQDLTTSLSPPYSDPEGNPPYRLKITSLPNFGILKLNGVDVVEDQEIEWQNIVDQELVYTSEYYPDSGIEGFQFMISDTGSQQYRG